MQKLFIKHLEYYRSCLVHRWFEISDKFWKHSFLTTFYFKFQGKNNYLKLLISTFFFKFWKRKNRKPTEETLLCWCNLNKLKHLNVTWHKSKEFIFIKGEKVFTQDGEISLQIWFCPQFKSLQGVRQGCKGTLVRDLFVFNWFRQQNPSELLINQLKYYLF